MWLVGVGRRTCFWMSARRSNREKVLAYCQCDGVCGKNMMFEKVLSRDSSESVPDREREGKELQKQGWVK
jgi:hypothetical protein